MYRRNKVFLAVFLSLALVSISLLALPARVKAPEQVKTYPSSVTVTSGSATGTVPDDISSEDGKFYTVVEEDTNPGFTFQNDTINPNTTGTFTEWDTGVGPGPNCDVIDHFGCVNEGPPMPGDENTSYVLSRLVATPGAVFETDTFGATDFTLDAGFSIDRLTIFGTALEVAPPPNGIGCASCILSGTTLTCGSPILLAMAWQEANVSFTTDPDTGLAWSEVGIDAVEIGTQLSWPGPGASPDARATLTYGIVQSSSPITDYTTVFQFNFFPIQGSEDPMLEIAGLRTGDTEAILVQVLRSGVWITLSENAFGIRLTMNRFGLSTTDVLGGSASVRIINSDATDDTQTTISIDEIAILTGGQATNPSGSITVQTRSEYTAFENRLLVYLFWRQVGGPEQADVINKWITVSIDGQPVDGGLFKVEGDHVFVPVPWGIFDGALHEGIVTGFVLINWTSGPVAYQSTPEKITLDNLIRLFVVISVVVLILIVVFFFVFRDFIGDRLEKM